MRNETAARVCAEISEQRQRIADLEAQLATVTAENADLRAEVAAREAALVCLDALAEGQKYVVPTGDARALRLAWSLGMGLDDSRRAMRVLGEVVGAFLSGPTARSYAGAEMDALTAAKALYDDISVGDRWIAGMRTDGFDLSITNPPPMTEVELIRRENGKLHDEIDGMRAMLDRIGIAVADRYHAPGEECIADGVDAVVNEAETLAAEVEQLRASNERLRFSVRAAHSLLSGPEINPSNYDHDDVCSLNSDAIEAYAILDAALTDAPKEAPGPGKPGHPISCDNCPYSDGCSYDGTTHAGCATRDFMARAPGGDATDRAAEPSGDPPAGREPASCGGSPATGHPGHSCGTCRYVDVLPHEAPCADCHFSNEDSSTSAWVSASEPERSCETCVYKQRACDDGPCVGCSVLQRSDCWTPKPSAEEVPGE